MSWLALLLLLPMADGFDLPVGPPDGDGYYDAQGFGGRHAHLGNDWNGNGGGDSDLGDPVFSIGAGRVIVAADFGGGWGNVVRVAHRVRDRGGERVIESLYAHLDRIDVHVGERLARGQQVGTIGTAHGSYRAHLHLEVRDEPGRPLGGGYGEPDGQVDAADFISLRRPRTSR